MNIRHYFIAPKLYPIFCLTVSLILGICWQSFGMQWFISLSVAAIITSVLMIVSKTSGALQPLYIIFYCIAFLLGCFRYHNVVEAQQLFCDYTNSKTFDITGTITDIHQTTNPHMRYAITLQIMNMVPMACSDAIYHGNEHIFLYTQSTRNLRIADTITVKNVQFKTAKNHDFMMFLLKEHVTTSAPIHRCIIELLKRPNYSWSRTIAEYRNRLLMHFKQCMDKETYLAFSSIFLGDPLAKKKEDRLKNQLKHWGLFHYIARAGLHLMIFVSIWMFIFALLPLPWVIRQIFIILLCGLYFTLTWPSIPFNRAFFTLLFVRTCGLLRLKTYYIPSLSLIAFITLLENPIALFALDFQLSFGVTFALAWFNEIRSQYR